MIRTRQIASVELGRGPEDGGRWEGADHLLCAPWYRSYKPHSCLQQHDTHKEACLEDSRSPYVKKGFHTEMFPIATFSSVLVNFAVYVNLGRLLGPTL